MRVTLKKITVAMGGGGRGTLRETGRYPSGNRIQCVPVQEKRWPWVHQSSFYEGGGGVVVVILGIM
jgi:hypothetical protein